MTEDAADHNFRVLERASFDVHSIIMTHRGCVTHPGDEFRPITLMDPIFKRHPLWHRVRRMLTVGAQFPLEPIDDLLRLSDLAAAQTRGNHGGATQKPEALATFFRDEVKKGWMLPLPLSQLDKIPNLCLSPVNIVEQGTIDMHGHRVKSERLTHDLSFDFGSGLPVNTRAIAEQLTPCFYGHALRRFCHYIVALRAQNPNVKIFLAKFDWKSAYRRLHFHGTTAPQCTMMLPPIAYMALRVTFGGLPAPSMWSDLSEMICDMSNQLRTCPEWDERKLRSSWTIDVIGVQKELPAAIPFARAQPTTVEVPVKAGGYCDVFIDDLLSCTAETDDRAIQRSIDSALLAMDTIGRPMADGDQQFFRDPVLSLKKALAEGTATELLIVLGWLLDTRRLLIQLPSDKRRAWIRDIDALLKSKTASYKALHCLIGRLQHVAAILPTARHFLGRLRMALAIAEIHGGCNLPKKVLSDLKLWKQFVNYAANGVSLNLLTFRLPNNIIRVDACPWGVGGYSLTTGRAWFINIPPHLRGRAHINWLEFVAAHIGTWVEIIWGSPATDSCFMAIGDKRASKLGLNAAELTHFIRTNYPTQIPATFHILDVPAHVVSDLFSRLQHMTVKDPSLQQPLPPTTSIGDDGCNSSTSSSTKAPMTRSYEASIQTNESSSLKRLGPQFDMDTSPHEAVCKWLTTHLKLPPQHMWHRPLGFPFAPMGT